MAPISDEIVYCGIFPYGSEWTYASRDGDNVANIADALATKVDHTADHRKAFSPYQGYVFQYIVEDDVCYMAAAHAEFSMHVTFSFLDRIKEEYQGVFAGTNRVREFRAIMEKEMDYFSHNPDADKLRSLQTKVDGVTDVLKGNIEKVLDRGAKLEDLEDKTDILTSHAEMFHQKSKQVKWQMWWESYKMFIVGGTLLVVVLILIVSFLYFSDLMSTGGG
eukprot:CAMPEP_0119126054 /NCGR_PEP_ID=MMETSP1310-20130426/5118_1 /TAXON_ID=464262 /ORGANISM="Genus nov. species nov., Strain RCC2339" /LENGTH=219 /DNA_ID=CAMNT_0007116183 /DNA_START=150 /DNA_END=805 /DNA_ORIENTATION=-